MKNSIFSPQTPEGGFLRLQTSNIVLQFKNLAPASNTKKVLFKAPFGGLGAVLFTFLLLTHLTFAQRTFAPQVTYATGTNPYSVAIGDLTGDGRADLAVANSNINTISVYTNTGSGSFAPQVTYNTGSNPYSVFIGDLTGDGKADLAVANYISNTVSVYTNTGSGSFAPQVTYATGSRPCSVAIVDLTGDGKADLAVANRSSNTVSVYTNTGSGTFAPQVTYATGTSPYSVAIGDLTGDGRPDLVVANSNSNTVSVYTNTGSGSFAAQVTYATGSGPFSVAIGDLTGDGKADLAVANNGSNTVSVYTNTGSGSFAAQVTYATGLGPISVAIGDLTGDGRADLAVANQSSNTVSVLTNTGSGTFAPQVTYATGTTPWSVAIGDLTGDGKADLAVANYNSNTVSVLIAQEVQFINGFLVSNKVYGSTFAFNATATSGLPVSYSSSNPSILSLVGNAATATGVGVVTVTAFQNGNATFAGVTLTGVLTITKANLTVQGNNNTRVYGTANPAFTSSVTGLVLGSTVNVTYSTTATPSSNVGNYPINISVTGIALANYNLTTLAGVLTITAKPATVSGNNFSREYSASNPIFTGSVLGLVNNDAITYSGSTSATSLSGIGVYAIIATAVGTNILNYQFSILNSNLSITAKSATVSGNNFNRVYGSTNPIFTGTVLGLVNGDVLNYSGSTTATSLSGVGVYAILATFVGNNVSNNYKLSILNSQLTITALAFVSTAPSPIVFNSTVYDGQPKVPSVVGLPSTSGVNYTYNGSSTAPTNAGSYTVVGIITDPNYTGTVTSVIIISPSDISNQLSVAGLSNSMYNGSPKTTSITGLPLGVASSVTYNGSPTAPTNAGTYTVIGIVNDNNYIGTVTSVIVISPSDISNQLSVAGLSNSVYNGSPKTTSITGLPSGVASSVTYNGSPTAPTNAGTYTVIGIVNDNNYIGTVTSVILISPSDISNQLSVAGLSNSMYNGSPKATSITGLPSGVASSVTYNGSPTAPTNAGTYTVIGIVNDNNYIGTVTSVILISPSDISNQLSVAGLSNSVYNGSPKATSITGLPSGVASSVTYNGSPTAPTNAGTYTVIGIVNDNNYVGTTTSTMVILPVSATIVGNNVNRVYGLANPIFTGTILGLVNSDVINYEGSTSATSLSGIGVYAIIATATGTNVGNYQFSIFNAQLTVTPANATASVSGIVSDGNIVNATVPTSITISGSGFEPGASVTVNGVVLSNLIVINGSTIIATLPAGSATSSNVSAIVQNPNQNPSASTAIVVVNANPTSTSLPVYQSTNLTVFPNPSKGSFTISASMPLGKIMIYTLDGKLVQTKTTNENKLFVSGISTGTYIVYVDKSSVKVVVE